MRANDADLAQCVAVSLDRAFTTIADAKDVVLVVEGSTLAAMVAHDKVFADFLALGTHAHSVICCRVSPIQKADIVAAVRYDFLRGRLGLGQLLS